MAHDEPGAITLARAQGRRERGARQVQARGDALRPVHGGGGRPLLSRHRRASRAGPAADSPGSGSAAAAATSSCSAPRDCGACTWSRCRRAARSTSSSTSTRRTCSSSEGRGSTEVWQTAKPRSRRSSGSAARCSRSRSSQPPLRQRHVVAGAAAVRHHRAQRDEPLSTTAISSSTAHTSSRTATRAPTTTSSPTTISCPIRSAGSRCGARTSSPTSSTASCRSTTAARPATGASSPTWAGNRFYLWIGQHETGRYSKAHKHESAAVLICLKGKGYTYTWPAALGMKPWEGKFADKVMRQDYEPIGLVSAAPMSGEWFHQHFGISRIRCACHRLARAQQPALAARRPAGRAADGLRRDRPQEGRHARSPTATRTRTCARSSRRRCKEGVESRMEEKLYTG